MIIAKCFGSWVGREVFKTLGVLFVLLAVGPQIAGAQLAQTGWTKFKGNAGNTGLGTGSGAFPSLRWANTSISGSPLIGPDGTVYVLPGDNSPITALNGKTGATIWSSPIRLEEATWAALTQSGYLFDSDLNSESIFGLSASTGLVDLPIINLGCDEPMAVGNDGTIYASVVINPTRLGSSLKAIDPTSGITKWTFQVESELSDSSGPAIAPDGTVIVEFEDEYVYALNPADGSIKWKFFAPKENGSWRGFTDSPVVDTDGTVYISYIGGTDGFIYALDGATGSTIWSQTLAGGDPSFTLGLNHTAYYFSNLTGYSTSLCALDTRTGHQIWDAQLAYYYPLAPAVAADGTVYVGVSFSGTSEGIEALNGATGALVWTYTLPEYEIIGSRGPGGASVAVAPDGSLCFSTSAGMYCLDSVNVESLALSSSFAIGGSNVNLRLTLDKSAPVGGLPILLQSSSSVVGLPNIASVPGGESAATFLISTKAVDVPTVVQIGVLPGINQAVTLTVNPSVMSSLTIAPATVPSGQIAIGTVTLNGPAGPSGMKVALSSSSSAAAVPASVTVSPGQSSATFQVSTTGVSALTTAAITATLGAKQFSQSISITPASLVSISVSPTTVQGGGASTGTVTLNGIAPPPGLRILLSSNSLSASVPTSVTVAPGQTAVAFQVSTTGVSVQTKATITATLGNQTQSGTLAITPAVLNSLTVSPTAVQSGTSATGTITVSGPAGPAGLTAMLSCSNPSVTLPTSVTVSSGQSSTTFQLTTTGLTAQTQVTVTASLNGVIQTATLTILPVTLKSFSVNPGTVVGGSVCTGTVTIYGLAGPSGATVALASNANTASVPGSVVIPSGRSSITFPIQTSGVAASSVDTLAASFNGATANVYLTVMPVTVSSVSLNPSIIAGAGVVAGQVVLSGVAPLGGLTVNLSSTNPSARVPSTIVVQPGQASALFSVTAAAVSAPTGATISVTLNTSTANATLTLTPINLAGIMLNPLSVTGGAGSTGTVSLNGPAPKGGVNIRLLSDLAGVTVPATVIVPSGQMSATFKLKSSPVPVKSWANITASENEITQRAVLTVDPPTVQAIILTPTSVKGGSNSLGKVTLNAPAPKGGLKVALSVGQSAAMAPASATVAAGSTSVTFIIKTKKVTSTVSASVFASANGSTASAVLSITQ